MSEQGYPSSQEMSPGSCIGCDMGLPVRIIIGERKHEFKPHIYWECTNKKIRTKAEAVMDAIRETEVGSDIIIHNEDMSVFCILTVKCKEHPEKLDEDGGKVVKP